MTDPRTFASVAIAGGLSIVCSIVLGACGTSTTEIDEGGGDTGDDFGGDGSGGDGGGDGMTTPPPTPTSFEVGLVANGVTGSQRVNFAVPFAPGVMTDEKQLRVLAGTVELPAARRILARHTDGSARSVQLQADVDVSANTTLTIELGAEGLSGPAMVAVDTTLTGSGNAIRPKVWAVLPTSVLAASQVAGPVLPRTEVEGTTLDAWAGICDYDQWDTDTFLVNASASRDVWLFDRVTAMYRGYAITGSASPLESAYREAAIYLNGMTISNNAATGIAVPGANTDLKYYYSQGMALHYLLTGDDRYREAAEAVSKKVAGMWDPNYDGTDEFWTERHAGFALLAHEWAMQVTDDLSAEIGARAETDVNAYLAAQSAARFGQTSTDARCFAHTATAHGEGWGGNGCSPWMSAIVADGLDAYARRVGGTRSDAVRAALGQLGRLIAREGRDSTGRPLYWMGVGGSADQIDDYEEHWGESAYIVALAWASTGKTDNQLRQVADELVTGLQNRGEVGQVRSFNWQCRSSVMTPAFLK